MRIHSRVGNIKPEKSPIIPSVGNKNNPTKITRMGNGYQCLNELTSERELRNGRHHSIFQYVLRCLVENRNPATSVQYGSSQRLMTICYANQRET